MAARHEKVMPDDSADDAESSDLGDTSNEDEEEDESGSGSQKSGDESDQDEESSEEEESDETDEGSDEEVWSDADNVQATQTQEATEAVVLSSFQSALDMIVNGEKIRAITILNDLLKHPVVRVFTTIKFDWDKETDERISKMARVFVGAHKNLAGLEPRKAIDHYLQVLSVVPRNDGLWMSLGQKCVEEGDLDMASFAFEKSGDWRAEEALLSTHFLAANYRACALRIQRVEEEKGRFLKGEFLKRKIRAMGGVQEKMMKEIFGEEDDEDNAIKNDEFFSQAEIRLTELLSKLDKVRAEKFKMEEEEIFLPIPISIQGEHTLWNVLTIFCDLFDRIQAYSSLTHQKIELTDWEDGQVKLDVEATMEEMLEVIGAMDSLLDDVEDAKDKRKDEQVERNRWKKGMGNGGRKSQRRLEEGDEPSSVDSALSLDIEPSELSRLFDVRPVPYPLLRQTPSPAPPRPSSSAASSFPHVALLSSLRANFLQMQTFSLFSAFDVILSAISASPTPPSVTGSGREVLCQSYRRFTQMSSRLIESRHTALHILMNEFDEPVARGYCSEMLMSPLLEEEGEEGRWTWPSKEIAVRFAWKHALTVEGEEREEMLGWLAAALNHNDAIPTASGILTRSDVMDLLEKREREKRIQSLRELEVSREWEEIVRIGESDVDWNRVEESQLFEIADVLARALLASNRLTGAIELVDRVLTYILAGSTVSHSVMSGWLLVLESPSLLSLPPSPALSSLVHTLLRLTEHSHLARDWKLWKIIHSFLKQIEGALSVESLESWCDSDCADSAALPSRSLRILSIAHEKLAAARLCAQDDGAFLVYLLGELHAVGRCEAAKKMRGEKKFAWVWNNFTEEVAQCLHCMFGKYSKKKKTTEDHETDLEMAEDREGGRLAGMAVALSLPCPLPLFDDNVKVSFDLLDLVQSRFPSMLQVNERRKISLDRFRSWLRQARDTDMIWPHDGCDSHLQATLFYILAFHNYRQNKHEEAQQYAECFLSSTAVESEGEAVAVSAWVMLAHSMVYFLFDHYDDDLFLLHRWYVRPFRIAFAIRGDKEPEYAFFLGQSLYQVSTRLSRFFERLRNDDVRLRGSLHLLTKLRRETGILFEKVAVLCYEVARGNQAEWDLQWLAFFYLAKLQAKEEDADIVKVVDGLYEAACSLQLHEWQYPTKIGIKSQKYLEPVEVHYQVHSFIWKYISRTENPDVDTLLVLLGYARVFLSHGVNRQSGNLFSLHPDIHATAARLSFLASSTQPPSQEKLRKQLINELTDLCFKAFELVTDRFPHCKAHYRLAEMSLCRGEKHSAAVHLFKGCFRRKKKDDDLLLSVVEMSNNDIERADSLAFHCTRAAKLAMRVAAEQGDLSFLIQLAASIVHSIKAEDESRILKTSRLAMLEECGRLIEATARRMPQPLPKAVRIELHGLYSEIEKERVCMATVQLRVSLCRILRLLFGSVAEFEGEAKQLMEMKKAVRKRKRVEEGEGSIGGIGSILQEAAKMMRMQGVDPTFLGLS